MIAACAKTPQVVVLNNYQTIINNNNSNIDTFNQSIQSYHTSTESRGASKSRVPSNIMIVEPRGGSFNRGNDNVGFISKNSRVVHYTN